MGDLMHRMVEWLVATVGALGYPGILALMAIESSFIPFPSEVVMIPAGYLAAEGRMNVWLAIGSGVAGSLLGAWVNYLIAERLGRPFILRYGRYVGITPEKFARVDTFFGRHGEITTFVGRLIPGIRQLISFPAGLGRMPRGRFALFTTAGAGLWVCVLVALGYWIGENKELLARYSRQASLLMIGLAVALTAGYILLQRRRRAA